MNMILFAILMGLVSWSYSITVEETTLEYVFAMMRNPARAPIRIYPTSNYKDTYWNRYFGINKLTSKGHLDQFTFGQLEKAYFKDLLPQTYSMDDYWTVSVDFTKYNQAVQVFSAGFYPPVFRQIWNIALRWIPIPVQTETFNFAYYLINNLCPAYTKAVNDIKASTTYQNIINQSRTLVTRLATFTGISTLTAEGVPDVADALDCELNEGLKIPSWAVLNLNNINKLRDDLFLTLNANSRIARFTAGQALEKIRSVFREKVSGVRRQKFLIYSKGAQEMAGLLSLLLNGRLPNRYFEFSSAIFLELRKDAKNNRYVKLAFKNNPPSRPISFTSLVINGCSDVMCPLDTFLNVTSAATVTDLEGLCKS